MANQKYRPIRVKKKDGKIDQICQKCDLVIDKSKGMYHCQDCQVCVTGYDHHCVFFSKCIAGGNIITFWLTLGMIIFNLIFIMTMVIMHG